MTNVGAEEQQVEKRMLPPQFKALCDLPTVIRSHENFLFTPAPNAAQDATHIHHAALFRAPWDPSQIRDSCTSGTLTPHGSSGN
ncbi:hypothetical protein [Echinococcus multilocularis]|uniref:Uncharacterized protein n=1 Tax=Echinococcus multilocularis TaxID=6211 RepID=A0A068Y1S6_ECHMU|nr:hypothetical protein [Echinococcus multilocularis]